MFFLEETKGIGTTLHFMGEGKVWVYSDAAAKEFSEMMAKRNGWSSYGDVDYVSHVTKTT